MLQILIREQMYTPDTVYDCCAEPGLTEKPVLLLKVRLSSPSMHAPGALKDHLGDSKDFYNKMSIKGKQMFDAWAQTMKDNQAFWDSPQP